MLLECHDTTGQRECKTVGLCRDCKHWGCFDDTREPFRLCRGMENDTENQTRTLNAWDSEELRPDLAETQPFRDTHMAVTVNSIVAELRTRGDFGCVLFEPKETTNA